MMRLLLLTLFASTLLGQVSQHGKVIQHGKVNTILPSTLLFATGNYVGNATADRAVVTGMAFTPKVVMISSNGTAAPVIGVNSMAEDYATIVTGGGGAGMLTSIDVAGFTISDSASVNANGVTFIWWAMGGNDVVTGTYTGDGLDGHVITGAGFTPGFLMVVPSAAVNLDVSLTGTVAGPNLTFYANGGGIPNSITSLTSDGFTLGVNQSVNQAKSTFYWWAISSASASVGQGSYVGDTNDNRNITGLAFNPAMVLIAPDAGIPISHRTSAHTGDVTKLFWGIGVSANYIQSLGTTAFQIGSSTYVNGAFTYYFWYFRNAP